jgi:hypothetical protein
MFRRKLALAGFGLLLVFVGLSIILGRPVALTLNIGSGAITQVQSGSVVVTTALNGSATLPVASTAGTTLIAIVALNDGGLATTISFPPGWARLASKIEGANNAQLEVWGYLNNPGGITAVTWSQSTIAVALWLGHLSEWANVRSSSVVETSGGASATSGTTLAPTTTGNVLTAGDLAISAWYQFIGVSAVVAFTTPGGFTRLVANGAVNGFDHLDAEYKINPATGATLGPTLTSDHTTSSAAGVIVVLLAAPPVVDQTAFLKYGTLAQKLNTADFQLIDPATIPSLGDPVVLTNPTWSGRVVSVTRSDIVDHASGHKLVTIAATNQTAAGATTAPGDLSDVVAGGHILLESGSGALLLEDGSGYLLLEGTSFSYQGLSVSSTQNIDGTVTTYGVVTVFETGFAAGQTFNLTSGNLGYSSQAFVITNVTNTFIGANPPSPAYLIEFGDPYLSLQLAGAGVLTKQGSVASIQAGVYIPAGVLGYAQVTANQGTFTALTDLTGLTVTATIVSGRRIRIRGNALFSSSSTGDTVQLQILEGAAVLAIAQTAPGTSGQSASALVEAVLTPSTGVHTYKLSALRQSGAGNITMAAGATFPAFISVEDIGT